MLENNMPKHVAIIMDGNNRWTKKHKLAKFSGHKKGRETLKNIVKHSVHIGLKILTLFAFSSENKMRPKKEVGVLFKLFLNALKTEAVELKKANIKLKIIGDISIFDQKVRAEIKKAEIMLTDCSGMHLIIALNYSGKWDIVKACQKIASATWHKKIKISDIDENLFAKHLSLADYPTPDLLIRTSGEVRISNFLLWEIAYSELYFTPVLWPDFTPVELDKAIVVYQKRNRRFGKRINKSVSNKID